MKCPTLVLRGQESDLLLASAVAEMRRRNALVRVVEFPGIGHAPWPMSDDQINVVRDFLLSPALPP